MRSKWSDEEAAAFVAHYGDEWGVPLALRTYSSRLLGSEPGLVLHGGGNSSVKAPWRSLLGEEIPAIFVKGSGLDMASIDPAGHPGLDLGYLRRLRALSDLDDATMVDQLRTHLLCADSPTPSIEALVHAFLPATFIDHTHADVILALTNRADGLAFAQEALGEEVIVLPYLTPGFQLAQAAADALAEQPGAVGMVWSHHGLVTWGPTARESYEATVDLVSRAERFLESRRRPAAVTGSVAGPVHAEDGASNESRSTVVPLIRGALAEHTGDCDRPYRRVVVQSLTDADMLTALAAPHARENLVSPPLTTDHLIRTKALPLWLEGLPFDDDVALREQIVASVDEYCRAYEDYLTRHESAMPPGVQPFDSRPRVVLVPGVGAFCAGPDLCEAMIARDITAHTVAVKTLVAETAGVEPATAAAGSYVGLPEAELFKMEYRTLQHAKLSRVPTVAVGTTGATVKSPAPAGASPLCLRGHVAVVTGAAGAIGTGICWGLLAAGCLVAATDLPGEPLDRLVSDLAAEFGPNVVGVPLDVTDSVSVGEAFARVTTLWGGVDLVIPNAGIAAVASLTDLDLECYRRLERVNVEGTLLVLSEAARLLRRQGTGGDIVLVSTKNVFAPGANFGAYSSTKAAAHQLGRIASLELASDDIRVNMVAPDAVFSHGTCRSGLWAEVGPDRMKARGLDEAGLETYYQNRNLLKARVTAEHVANAILFFATRQTPTTGATLPVDGGLPDSTPR
ncbi:MAG: bifunctional aldolase/short-chain dehydrogenase [Thermoleophilia bacterium]|jgi:rhamnose utilization protein RhaD (predicted bifunctional aldolase and dehydrogenase)/NAD(P)-dependent dehydrogenase (short-subunit alcohol dehydrogenase family)